MQSTDHIFDINFLLVPGQKMSKDIAQVSLCLQANAVIVLKIFMEEEARPCLTYCPAP